MQAEFKLSVGQKKDGTWWARIDGSQYYAVSGDNQKSPSDAIVAALFEASHLIADELEDVGQVQPGGHATRGSDDSGDCDELERPASVLGGREP